MTRIATQREREHCGLTPFPSCRQFNVAVGGIDQAHIDWRALFKVIPAGFALVVIAVVFDFEQQRVPWGLVGDATKDANWTLEHIAESKLAGLVDVAARNWSTVLKAVVDCTQRVREITSIANVASRKADRRVDRSKCLTGNKILA